MHKKYNYIDKFRIYKIYSVGIIKNVGSSFE